MKNGKIKGERTGSYWPVIKKYNLLMLLVLYQTYACWQNWEKRPLASSYLSVHPSASNTSAPTGFQKN